MDTIAFVIGSTRIYWNSILLGVAALVGMLLFLAFYLWREPDCLGAFLVLPLAAGASLVCARLTHWYFRPDSYRSFAQAMTDFSGGGLALMGCFIGCFLAAGLVALFRRGRGFASMLDAMSLAGAAAIGVGRLSGFCNSTDRGQVLPPENPFGSFLMDPLTGQTEYRLATFALQAAVAGVIFLLLLGLYIWGNRPGRKKAGDLFWLFSLYYGASQAVLDSTRYDSLFFRSNGFVSVVQILCVLAVVVPLVVFGVRYGRAHDWIPALVALEGSCGVLLAGAGWMEYYVQRHGSQAAFAYSVMSGCMGGICILGSMLWYLARRREIPREMPTIYERD